MKNFIHLHFSCMSNLFMSYLHIPEVDGKKEKMHFSQLEVELKQEK